jgi:hypothetical protein
MTNNLRQVRKIQMRPVGHVWAVQASLNCSEDLSEVGRVRAVRLGGTKYAEDRMAIKGTELEVSRWWAIDPCVGRGAAWRLYQRLAITSRSDGEVCSGYDNDGETSIIVSWDGR